MIRIRLKITKLLWRFANLVEPDVRCSTFPDVKLTSQTDLVRGAEVIPLGIDPRGERILFAELDRLRRAEDDARRLRGIELRAQGWDRPDATNEERRVAQHILGLRKH